MSVSGTLAMSRATRSVGWTALLAAALTAGLMVYGGWVRASGSGLGCPDWPLCKGTIVPELDRTTAIEYGHRLYAGVTMMATAAAAWLGFRQRRADPTTYRLLLAALGAILIQAVLGGVTVLTDLHGLAVVAHLAMAMAILAVLTAGALRSLLPNTTPGIGLGMASALLAGGAMVVLMGGVLVGTERSAGCPGLPLCDGRSSGITAALHALHRILGVVLLAALVAAAVRLRSRRKSRLSVSLMHAGILVMGGQMAVGVVSVALSLPEGLRVLHLALATMVWWLLAGTWSLAFGSRSPP